MAIAEHQYCELRPPRRGLILAVTVDSTARAYDLSALDLGNDGQPPVTPGDRPRFVDLFMSADTNDVYFQFAPDTSVVSLDNAGTVAAGGSPVVTNAMGALLKAASLPIYFRINRQTDRYIIVKAASTAGTLRIWAASADSY